MDVKKIEKDLVYGNDNTINSFDVNTMNQVNNLCNQEANNEVMKFMSVAYNFILENSRQLQAKNDSLAMEIRHLKKEYDLREKTLFEKIEGQYLSLKQELIKSKKEVSKWMQKYYSVQSTAMLLTKSNEKLKKEVEELRMKCYRLESSSKLHLYSETDKLG